MNGTTDDDANAVNQMLENIIPGAYHLTQVVQIATHPIQAACLYGA